ncbi:hypothetical protein GVAV_002582 [Gurleya vavrai]
MTYYNRYIAKYLDFVKINLLTEYKIMLLERQDLEFILDEDQTVLDHFTEQHLKAAKKLHHFTILNKNIIDEILMDKIEGRSKLIYDYEKKTLAIYLFERFEKFSEERKNAHIAYQNSKRKLEKLNKKIEDFEKKSFSQYFKK